MVRRPLTWTLRERKDARMVLKGTVPQRMAANCRLTCHISVMTDILPSPESTTARLGARAAGPACRRRAAVASMASRRLVRAPSQTPLHPHPYYVTTGLRLSDATAGPDRAQLDLLCPPTRAGGQRCGGAPSSPCRTRACGIRHRGHPHVPVTRADPHARAADIAIMY